MSDPKEKAGFDFEECLREELSHMPPPEDVICTITPWRNATRRILVGCALTMITWNFLMLQYILPAIGTVMMLTGFRTLRRENAWFSRGYIAAWIDVILGYPCYFINATIWNGVVADHPAWMCMTMVRTAAYLVQLIALWQGMRQVQQKAGQKPAAKAGLVLVVLYVLMWLLITIRVTSGLLIWLMLILYIIAWRNLRKLSRELDDVGYVIRSAPVRVPDLAVQVTYFALIFLCVTIGYAGFSKYPMEWSVKQDIYDSSELETICGELTALGFPQEVLEDMTPEDILQCRGAKRVVAQRNAHEMVSGEYGEIRGAGDVYLGKHAVKRMIRITEIAVELAGETEQWKLIQHFSWMTEPKMIGTEAIQMWTADHVELAWYRARPLSGQVLYDQADIAYTAPYYSIENTEKRWETYLNFSFPNDGERYRGYVTYTIQKQGLDGIIDNALNYMHHIDLLRYPVRTASEYRKNHGFFMGQGPYDLIQDVLQFYPPWLDEEAAEQQNGTPE